MSGKGSPKDNLSGSRDFLKYSNIAMRMIVIILIGVLGGRELDAYFNNEKSILTFIFSILSVIAAMYVIIKEINSK